MNPCNCLTDTQLCARCLNKLLDEHAKIRVQPADGLTKLKMRLKCIWSFKADQDKALTKIYDFYVGPTKSKSGTWLFLGKAPGHVLISGTEPTVWLYNNEIRIEAAQHAKYLKAHSIPYVQ